MIFATDFVQLLTGNGSVMAEPRTADHALMTEWLPFTNILTMPDDEGMVFVVEVYIGGQVIHENGLPANRGTREYRIISRDTNF